jgi:hypothetical protein
VADEVEPADLELVDQTDDVGGEVAKVVAVPCPVALAVATEVERDHVVVAREGVGDGVPGVRLNVEAVEEDDVPVAIRVPVGVVKAQTVELDGAVCVAALEELLHRATLSHAVERRKSALVC